MRIQPRRQILDIWRSVVRSSFQDGVWVWGGRDESNSISDAEQLLCLLYPATELINLVVDRPGDTAEDVAKALEGLGDSASIPQTLIDVMADYLDRYTDERAEPIFAAGSYLRTAATGDGPDAAGPQQVTEAQQALGVVDSYSMSVTLCLAGIGFVRVYRPVALSVTGRASALTTKIERIEKGFQDRLTCAMVGLLRSYVVNTISITDPAYNLMLQMMNQGRDSDDAVLERLQHGLYRTRIRLRDDVRIGVNVDEAGLDDRERLFECGWGWGIVRNAPPVEIELDGSYRTTQPHITHLDGIADPQPYLYSTVSALYGINDLRSDRTRGLSLLNDDQRRLNDALQLRAEMTQRYWSTLARLGEEMWPLENIPWRTSDGEESEYFSLWVSAILLQDFMNREVTDDDMHRMVQIFESLAQHGRITRRVTYHDEAAVAMHVPGLQARLDGTATLGPQLYWSVAEFAPLLLKCTVQAARLIVVDIGAKDQLMWLAEASMDHLIRRRINYGTAAGVWDDPAEVLFPHEDRKPIERPSWYLTVRVLEALVSAAKTFAEPPLRSSELSSRAINLLHEADHLLNQQMLEVDANDNPARRAALASIEAALAMTKRVVARQPGTASALANEALRMLAGAATIVTQSRASKSNPQMGAADRELRGADAPKFQESAPAGDNSRLRLVQRYQMEGADGPRRGDVVPVAIYLESNANAMTVEQAVLDVLYMSGFVVDEAKPPVAGSWFRVMTARLKEKIGSGDVLDRIERALEIQALDRPQAEVDAAQADAVAKLITALSQDLNAFIQIGSVFLIKVDGVTVVRNLSQRELSYLQQNSRILATPRKILQALDEFATRQDGSEVLMLGTDGIEAHAKTDKLGRGDLGKTTDEIIIEQHPIRVGVCRPSDHGNVNITLDNGQGSVSNYDVTFNRNNGARPTTIRPTGAVHVQADSQGMALLHEDHPTLIIKRAAGLPHHIEMTLDCGDGPMIYTLQFSDPG